MKLKNIETETTCITATQNILEGRMKQLYGSGDGVKVNEIKGLYFLLAVNISNPPPKKKTL